MSSLSPQLFLSVLPALTPAEIISQILGILALVCNIFCYQMKSPKKLLFWQITASVMWILNLGIKGAVVGVLLNVHAVVRLTVYYFAENHKWARSKVWLPVFMISAAAIVILTYTEYRTHSHSSERSAPFIPSRQETPRKQDFLLCRLHRAGSCTTSCRKISEGC